MQPSGSQSLAERAWTWFYRPRPTGAVFTPTVWRRRDRRRSEACGCWRGSGDESDTRALQNFRTVPVEVPIYIIVHGTFNRHARWAREGRLVARLEESGKVTRFCWSGRNVMRDRLDAAATLQSLLLHLLRQRPDLHLGLIAHSHGGNVVAHALDSSKLSIEDSALLEKIKVVAMATPFLSASPRSLSTAEKLGAATAGYIAFTLAFVAALYPALSAVSIVQYGLDQTLREVVPSSPTGFIFLFAALLLGMLFVQSIWGLFSLGHRVGAPPFWRILRYDSALSECERFTPDTKRLNSRLLVLRSPSDEAALVLGAGSLASWVSNLFVERIRWGFLLAPFCISVAASVMSPSLLDDSPAGVLAQTVLNATALLMGAAFTGVVLALIVQLLAASAFGFDMLTVALYANLHAEAAPLGAVVLHMFDVEKDGSSRTSRLRHGVYDSEFAIEQCIRHLTPSRTSSKVDRTKADSLASIAVTLINTSPESAKWADALMTQALEIHFAPAQALLIRAKARLRMRPPNATGALMDATQALSLGANEVEALTVRIRAHMRAKVGPWISDLSSDVNKLLHSSDCTLESVGLGALALEYCDDAHGALQLAQEVLAIDPALLPARFVVASSRWGALEAPPHDLLPLLQQCSKDSDCEYFALLSIISLAIDSDTADLSLAHTAARKFRELHEDDFLAHYVCARFLERTGDTLGATIEASRAIQARPQESDGYLLRARLNGQVLGQSRAMNRDLRIARYLDPSLPPREVLFRELATYTAWQRIHHSLSRPIYSMRRLWFGQ